MESTTVDVDYQIISTISVEFMPGVHKCLKIRAHALSPFTQTYTEKKVDGKLRQPDRM
jgi:hypothetical protein